MYLFWGEKNLVFLMLCGSDAPQYLNAKPHGSTLGTLQKCDTRSLVCPRSSCPVSHVHICSHAATVSSLFEPSPPGECLPRGGLI